MNYKLYYNNVEFWKKKYDEQTKEEYYERVTESGSLYFRKTDKYFLSDKMMCNCINDASDNTEHMRITPMYTLRDSFRGNDLIIEPSEIKLSFDNLKEIKDGNDIGKDKNNVFIDISKNTFICNNISAKTRGGRNRISASEVETFKKEIIDVLGTSLDANNFRPFDLVSTFSLIAFKMGIHSFDRDKLIEFIIEHKEEEKYSRILKYINIEYGEHYDSSEDINNAVASLKYFGMLHADYSQENSMDFNPYINLRIDKNIFYLDEIGVSEQLKSLYPEMFEFVKEYLDTEEYIIPGIRNTAKRRNKTRH